MTEDKNKKLQQLISDLKILLPIDIDLNEIKTKRLESPVTELLEYAVQYNIISSAADLLYVCRNCPDIEERLIKIFDDNQQKKIKEASYYSYRCGLNESNNRC